MNPKMRTIEVDLVTATLLESRAAQLGVTVSDLVAELIGVDEPLPKMLGDLRRTSRGPWAPSVLAEDARRYEAFEQTGEGVPWEDVEAWVKSWGTAHELPKPKPRKP